MDDKIFCKDCCREIDIETSNKYKGYCKSCYDERNNSSDETTVANWNGFHKVSIYYLLIIIISSIVAGFNIPTETYDDFNIFAMLIILFSGFISFFVFFMLATIIQELRNIQDKQ